MDPTADGQSMYLFSIEDDGDVSRYIMGSSLEHFIWTPGTAIILLLKLLSINPIHRPAHPARGRVRPSVVNHWGAS